MITQDELKRNLNYDPSTGIFTRIISNSPCVKVGSIAGSKSPNSSGYITLMVNGKLYQEHRLVWLYFYGEFPKGDLDHINNNKTDNRIENLRVSSRSENKLNVGLNATNTSGYKGVSWNKQAKKWCASAKINGKTNYLGLFEKLEDAAKAYICFAKISHKEFIHKSLI